MNQTLQLSSLILSGVVVCGLCVCFFFWSSLLRVWFVVCGVPWDSGPGCGSGSVWVTLDLFVVCGLWFFLGLLAGRSGVQPRVPEKNTNHKQAQSPRTKPQATNHKQAQSPIKKNTNHKPQTSPESPKIDFLKDLVGGSLRIV